MPDDLPELPPEWGSIVIPDDASALADEAEQVRRELRLQRRQRRWRWLVGPPAGRTKPPGLRAPLLIMAVAVLVTLASLFTAAWPGTSRPPNVQRTSGSAPSRNLPALDLVAPDGQLVALRGLLPAVILLVDGCQCDEFAAATAGIVRSGTSVVAVTGRSPAASSSGAAATTPALTPTVGPIGVRRLADPTDGLRNAFDIGAPDGTAAAVIVARDGTVVRAVQHTMSVEDLRADLARL